MTIFDEEEYGKYLYDNQKNPSLVPKVYNARELTILAKYLREKLNKSETDIRNNIIKFCNLNYPGFDADIEYEKINKVMVEVYKTNLRKSLPVPITKSEWEAIQKTDNEKYQKLLFGYLVVAKFNRINPVDFVDDSDDGRVYKDDRLRCYVPEADIYKLMKIGLNNSDDLYEPYGVFGKCGLNLVNTLRANTLKRVLNYGEMDPNPEDIILEVDDYNEIYKFFMALKNQSRIKKCKDCGNVFIDDSPTNKQYKCKNCKGKVNKVEGELVKLICVDCKEIFYTDKHTPSTREGLCRCEACAKKRRTSKKIEYNNKRSKGDSIIKICEKCFGEFKVSPVSKKNLCEDCYNEYRKEYRRKKISEYRTKE